MDVDDLIQELREHDPERKQIIIKFVSFQSNDQVFRLAQALNGNERASDFFLYRDVLLFSCLLNELANREKLEKVTIWRSHTARFLPLFRDQIVQRFSEIQICES